MNARLLANLHQVQSWCARGVCSVQVHMINTSRSVSGMQQIRAVAQAREVTVRSFRVRCINSYSEGAATHS